MTLRTHYEIWYSTNYVLVSMFGANFDALAQASDIRIEKKTRCLPLLNAGFEPRVSDTKSPARWMPADKPTELSRFKLILALHNPSLWSAIIQHTRPSANGLWYLALAIYMFVVITRVSEVIMFSPCVFVCLFVSLSRCLSGRFNHEGLVPHKQYVAGTLLGMSSCASYVLRTHDVIDDVTRSQSRSNFESDISPSIFELERRS